MERVARLLNDMAASGVISGYAVFGAVALMRYTEAVATLDADVLVVVPEPHGVGLRRYPLSPHLELRLR
jgi:hypothetical protein